MAAGVPVVATDVGGLSEIVLHRQTGLLVPVHYLPGGQLDVDVPRLAEAQLSLWNSPIEAAGYAAAAKRRLAREFTATRMVNAIIAAYEECLSWFLRRQ